MEDYFIAGRSLPWWLAGTSLAATWFATDAPLAAASLVRQHGIFGNWLWWYEAGGLMLLVFFFAKFWRRANIVTDAEFMELRYSGKEASALRVIAAVYNGLLKNCVVMGWVMLAMVKFAEVLLGWDAATTLVVCVGLAVVYTSASGIWGVVTTDMFQFVTGLVGSLILAGIVLNTVGGPSGLVEQIQNLKDAPKGALDIVPNPSNLSSLEFASYMCLILVLWSRSGHDGYSGQRLFATKNDKHAVLSAFLWGFLAITVMTWPWIVVGLGSLIILPISEASPALAADPELAYPMMLGLLMPIGLKGLLVASFLAAFMSTMDTHLCWGGSYLVNDVYKRFFKPDAKPSEYVWASRLSILVLAGCAALTAYYMESIEKAWIYLIDLTAGMAIIWALRWYWWRVNARAEITAMLTSLVLANGGFLLEGLMGLGLISASTFDSLYVLYTDDFNMIRALIILVVTTIVWISVVYLTKPTHKEVLTKFYRVVKPSGWWGEIAEENPDIQSEVKGSTRWLGWLLGLAFIYGSLLGIGYLIIAQYLLGTVLIIVCLISLYFLIKRFEINPTGL